MPPPHRRRSPWLWVAPGALLAALSAPRGALADGAEPIGTVTSPIVGGTTAATCNWASTAFLGDCTAVLIHPRVLVTAAHCAPKAGDRVTFGERTPWAFTVVTTKCVTSGDPSGNRDWAYCVLPDDARLRSVPIIPPIHGCEKSRYMTLGATAVAVGFGQTALVSPAGVKRDVEVALTNVSSALYVDVDGDAQHGLCHGDSGGPLFLHIVDGAVDYGWRTVGTVTGLVGTGTDCAGGTRFMSLDQHILAIETNEGIDVTPCTDMLGKWAPGPGCTRFPTDPGNASGTWPSCSPGPLSGPIDTCGPAIGSGGSGATGAGGSAASGAGGRAGAGQAGGAGGMGTGGQTGSGTGGAATGGTSGAGGAATGVTSGTGGAPQGSAGGGAGGTGENNAGSATTGGDALGAADDHGGCSCRVGAVRGAGRFAGPLALFALALSARRRRQRQNSGRLARAKRSDTACSGDLPS